MYVPGSLFHHLFSFMDVSTSNVRWCPFFCFCFCDFIHFITVSHYPSYFTDSPSSSDSLENLSHQSQERLHHCILVSILTWLSFFVFSYFYETKEKKYLLKIQKLNFFYSGKEITSGRSKVWFLFVKAKRNRIKCSVSSKTRNQNDLKISR